MSTDLREVFPILENPDGTGGYAVTKAVEGQAASSISGAVPALVAKDVSGNLIFLQLNSQGQLPVTTNSAGVPERARGELPAGYSAPTGATILVTGAQLLLGNGKVVTPMSFVVSCFRETHAQLISVDNGSSTILDDVLLGPGQYTFALSLPGDTYTTGVSGVQTLEVRARNTTTYASSIRASVVATVT